MSCERGMQTIPPAHIDLHLQLTVESPEYTDHLQIEDFIDVFRHASMISIVLVGILWLRIAHRLFEPR